MENQSVASMYLIVEFLSATTILVKMAGKLASSLTTTIRRFQRLNEMSVV